MKQYSRFGVLFLIAMAQLLVAVVSFGDSTPTPSASPAPSYVRISRAFFEKPLQAQIKLSSPNSSDSNGSSNSKTYTSSVDWVQYPPTSPAPEQNNPQLGQVLADFRDFVACAEMTELGESRLCFKVMADVSNLGVNDNEMTLRGVDSIDTGTASGSSQAASAQCSAGAPTPTASSKPAADGGPTSRYQLQKATVSANSLELEFKYSNGCGPNVQLTLTQVP